MFDFFKNMGQMADLLRHLPRIQEAMNQLQQRLGQVTAEGDAGAGMVKVKANGRMEIVSCKLSDEALRLQDRELLEELIRSAVNQALSRVREQASVQAGQMAAELGLPAGMKLPGMG
jgi:DNA-binding YbaB/EbfC family protein